LDLGFCLPLNSPFHGDKASLTRCRLEALWGWFPASTGGVNHHCIIISRRYRLRGLQTTIKPKKGRRKKHKQTGNFPN